MNEKKLQIQNKDGKVKMYSEMPLYCTDAFSIVYLPFMLLLIGGSERQSWAFMEAKS